MNRYQVISDSLPLMLLSQNVREYILPNLHHAVTLQYDAKWKEQKIILLYLGNINEIRNRK